MERIARVSHISHDVLGGNGTRDSFEGYFNGDQFVYLDPDDGKIKVLSKEDLFGASVEPINYD